MKAMLSAALLLILSAGFARAQDTGGVRKAIEANNKKFIEAFNSGDAAAVGGMYASDARLFPPNSQRIDGSQGIQGFWQSLINAGVKVVRLETVQVESSGDIAYEVGNYTLTIPQADKEAITAEGKYVVVWKRQGPNWKLTADIWNSNKPAG